MSLSQNVIESLEEATGALRNALFHASRSERASTLSAISKVIQSIDTISKTDELLDNLDTMIDKVKREEEEDQ